MLRAVADDETETASAASETVGDVIARYLAEIGVRTIFGVIPIHNMPILDAVARQGKFRCFPARGEAGAVNLADYTRVTGGLGACMTSTGTSARNVAVPDFATFCNVISMPCSVVRTVDDFPAALDVANGAHVGEVDAIGPFSESFSGPPAGAAGNKV